MTPTVAVLTMTRARHDNLLAQVDGLSVGSIPPQVHSVVSMGDRDLTRGRLPLATDRWTTIVRPVQTDRRALPIAAARNRAAANAVEAGADVLIFLDDVVIPGPRTLERLAEAVCGQAGPPEPVAGPVAWRAPLYALPPLEDGELGYPLGRLADLGRRVPGTPSLLPGQFRVEPRWNLFSGACFAMSATDFAATGGFCEDYTGQGLQDADFAHVLRGLGGTIVWVGGADAYRQPVEPVPSELQARYAQRHAQVWQGRWGSPAEHPWLARLTALGLLEPAKRTGGGNRCA